MVRMLTKLHSSYESLLPENRIRCFNSTIAILISAKNVEEILDFFREESTQLTHVTSNFYLFCLLRHLRAINTQYWNIREVLAKSTTEKARFIECLSEITQEAIFRAINLHMSVIECIQLVIYELRQQFDKR